MAINLAHGINEALLLKAVAADSKLSATLSALRISLMKKIKLMLKSNKKTVSMALTMMSNTQAAVSMPQL